MTRIKRGSVAKQYRKKILKSNKGFYGSHSTLIRTAKQQNMRALRYSYCDRRRRRRDFRSLWIKRINSFARLYGNISYNQLKQKLTGKCIFINRKILAQICINDSKSFHAIMNTDIKTLHQTKLKIKICEEHEPYILL